MHAKLKNTQIVLIPNLKYEAQHIVGQVEMIDFLQPTIGDRREIKRRKFSIVS
jgi:hypothetical protein